MNKPDFSKYSLALYEGNCLIFSSRSRGLRPLIESLEKFNTKSGLILHDKVIGLAAAKFIVYSGIIKEVVTGVASIPAKKYLEEKGIIIRALNVTANIMTGDKSAICPGEVIALNTENIDDFISKIKTMFNDQVNLDRIRS